MITSRRHPSVSRGMSSTGDMPAEPAGPGAVSRARPANRPLIFCVLIALRQSSLRRAPRVLSRLTGDPDT